MISRVSGITPVEHQPTTTVWPELQCQIMPPSIRLPILGVKLGTCVTNDSNRNVGPTFLFVFYAQDRSIVNIFGAVDFLSQTDGQTARNNSRNAIYDACIVK